MSRLQLVIGYSGLVGGALASPLGKRGISAVGTYNNNLVDNALYLDIRNKYKVKELVIEVNPSVIYLPASLTNVDYCESNPLDGYKTNVLGVSNMIDVANEVGAKLVYFSSDYIFDGENGPYYETDFANPICTYGRQKLIAEHNISLYSNDYFIIRTTGVYGWEKQGKNFVYRLINSLKEGKSVNVPNDQISTPTYAPNLAQVVVELVDKGAEGVYNVAGTQRCSRYEFACEVAKVFDLDTDLIHPVLTKELNQTAARPLEAGLIVDKVRDIVDTRLIGYEEGLIAMLGASG